MQAAIEFGQAAFGKCLAPEPGVIISLGPRERNLGRGSGCGMALEILGRPIRELASRFADTESQAVWG